MLAFAGRWLIPFLLHLAMFFKLKEIRCADKLTQNVVTDVFDELITHLHKGQSDGGCESPVQ